MNDKCLNVEQNRLNSAYAVRIELCFLIEAQQALFDFGKLLFERRELR